jgi:hypothetical protein
MRKAASLKAKRARELSIQHGGRPLSTGVQMELVHWARACAWAEAYDRAGDALKALQFGEKASGHNLKAIAIAEREARRTEAAEGPADPLGHILGH